MKKSPVWDMFARSPIRPIQRHMNKATDCVNACVDFITLVLDQDWDAAAKRHTEIVTLERSADDLKNDLRQNLPDGLFMALSRADILSLLSVQDKMANIAKDVSGLILGRRLQIPESMTDAMRVYVKRVQDAAQQAKKAIDELDALMEEGFRGQEVALIESMILKIDEIESATDNDQITLREQLFAIEKSLSPVDVIFLYDVIRLIGGIADKAEEVGGRLQLLMAR